MLTPSKLLDKDFKKRLSHFKSVELDKLLQELEESTTEAFINQCDSFPDSSSIASLNMCRVSLMAVFKELKTTNLHITED